jgi:hypothetical protein
MTNHGGTRIYHFITEAWIISAVSPDDATMSANELSCNEKNKIFFFLLVGVSDCKYGFEGQALYFLLFDDQQCKHRINILLLETASVSIIAKCILLLLKSFISYTLLQIIILLL